MKSLPLRDRILQTNDRRSEIVDLSKEFGWPPLECRSLSGGERARIQKMVTFNVDGTMKNRATSADTVIAGCYDPETGAKVFSELDRDALLEHNSACLEKLAEVINRLSGITKESADEAKEN